MENSKLTFNPFVEKIVDILCVKTQNSDKNFFRLQTLFYLSLIPSALNIKIKSPFIGLIPINFYGINLSPSGFGKGKSSNILEDRFLKKFNKKFMKEIFPVKAELEITNQAQEKYNNSTKAEDYDLILAKLQGQFAQCGNYHLTFSNATTPAIRQLKNKLAMVKIGSLNLIVDEIGHNMTEVFEALVTYLELYDVGKLKGKMLKNSNDNQRAEEVLGNVPANLLLFGTPSSLFDGAKRESLFIELLQAGYARRTFFNYSTHAIKPSNLTLEQQYDLLLSSGNDEEIRNIALKLEQYASLNYVGKVLTIPKEVDMQLLQYRRNCENLANSLNEYDDLRRSEILHRYFKTAKLAGLLAFIDDSDIVKMEHLNQAISFTESSGNGLLKMLDREQPYEKLAKYIASTNGNEITQADLTSKLPFYKGNASSKEDLMKLAIAWGYRNNIIIKRYTKDNIEFITGESLPKFDPNNIIVSYSEHIAEGYVNASTDKNINNRVPLVTWENLSYLVTANGYYWCNHYTQNGHRKADTMLAGFNLVVLDIDHEVSLQEVRILLSDYKYIIYTTKRHGTVDPETNQVMDRFRVILPMNYKLSLSNDDYKQFMKNLTNWLPFNGIDAKTFQPSRAWLCNPNATVIRNDEGKLLDVLPFIPKTQRNAEYVKEFNSNSLNKLENWFVKKAEVNGRNNTLYQYAAVLKDNGLDLKEIESKLLSLNSNFKNPLSKEEILNTIIVSLSNKL